MAGQTPAGWYSDPAGRYENRYWDGDQWTEHVASAGVASTDPLEPVAEPVVQAATVPVAAVPMTTTSDRKTGLRAMPWWAWGLIGVVALFFGVGAVGAATGGNDSKTNESPAVTTPSTHALVTSTTTSTTTTTTTTTLPPTTTPTLYVPPPTAPPATVAPTPPPVSCPNGSYVNSSGNTVCSPYESPGGAPAGASAKCNDGTYSFSQHRSGTCSGHGGVAQWL